MAVAHVIYNVHISKVIDAGRFWARESLSECASEEVREFQQVMAQMNMYVETIKPMIGHTVKPEVGMMYLGKCASQKGAWCRVRVKSVLHTSHGHQAQCFLVDYGSDNELIPLWQLRPIPEHFLSLPFQAKKCVLSGVKPVSKQMEIKDNVHLVTKPTVTWDSAAKTFVKKLIEGSSQQRIEVIGKDENDTLHVHLYVLLDGARNVCVNDLLVRENYAVYTEQEVFSDFQDVSSDVSSDSQTARDRQMMSNDNSQSADKELNDDVTCSSSNVQGFEYRGIHNVPSPAHPVALGRSRLLLSLDLVENRPGKSSPCCMGSNSSKGLGSDRGVKGLLQQTDLQESVALCISSAVNASDHHFHPATSIQTSASVRTATSVQTAASVHTATSTQTSASVRTATSVQTAASVHTATSTQTSASVHTATSVQTATSVHTATSVQMAAKKSQNCPPEAHSGLGTAELPVIGRGRGILSMQSAASTSRRSEVVASRSDISGSSDIKLQLKSPKKLNKDLKCASPLSQSILHSASSPSAVSQFSDNLNNVGINQKSTDHTVKASVVPGSLKSYEIQKSTQGFVPTKADSQSFTQNKSFQSFARANTSSDKEMKLKNLKPEDFQVKLYGIKKLNFIRRVEDAPFTENVKRVLHIYSIKEGTRVQQFAWPALLRGHDVLGVGLREKGGKSLAYIPPLITKLSETDLYTDLPISCGPYALIVAAGVQKAAEIHQYLARFQTEDRSWKLLMLSSENKQDTMEIDLLNGCEVLVATPYCLLRMLAKGVTNLARICYMIFDDLDMLLDLYPDQVGEVMRLYRKTINDRDEQIVSPKQVIAMTSVYSDEAEQFCRTHMTDPVLIIASQVEAACAANVKQMAVVCHESQRAEELVSQITVNFANTGHKIIVFVSQEAEVENLYSILTGQGIITLRAHHGLILADLQQIFKQWSLPHRDDSKPVLVCTDDIISSCEHEVNDATCIIHYDVPEKRSVLGKRLWCMRQNWRSPLEQEQDAVTKTKKCLSYFYITDSNTAVASNIIKLLERCQSSVPQKLHEFAARYEEEGTPGKRTTLCDQLKAFGRCCSGQRCHLRHRVVHSLDSPEQSNSYVSIPQEGQLKVLITHVVHASCYYARLLEVTDCEGRTHKLSSAYVNLVLDMSLWYNSPENKVPCELPHVNKLYAYEDTQHVFNRVLLLETGRFGSKQLLVSFVDTGAEQKIAISDLLELPAQFANVPYQAVEVYICRVRPKDRETMWPKHVNATMACHVESKELVGNIVLSLGSTLWLDPLVSHTKLKHLDLVAEEYSVRGLLLESEQAEPNPEHLQMLYNLCSGVLDLSQLKESPTKAFTVHNLLVNTKTRELPMTGDYVEVLIQAVDTPDLFYVQLKDDQESIEQLEIDITDYIRHNELHCPQTLRPSVLVLAKFPGTNTWNRARVSASLPNDEYDLYFVDFGDTEVVKRSDVLPMPSRFQIIPFYAIECCLVGVEPIGDHWTDEDGNILYEITRRCVNGEEAKVLKAKVVSRATARYSGKYVYGLELLDTSMPYCVNISHELVLNDKAKLSSRILGELFPQLSVLPAESDVAKIIKSCTEIVKSQDLAYQAKAAEVIKSIIRSNLRMKEELVNQGVIQALSLVLQLRRQPVMVEIIVIALVNLVRDSESLCNELWNQGGFNSLIYLLNTTTNDALRKTLIWATQQLVTVKSCVKMLNELRTYSILSVLLAEEKNIDESIVLDVLSVLLRDISEGDLNDVDKCGCLKTLSEVIQNTSDPHSILVCFQILDNMARSCESARDKIRKNGGVLAVCHQFARCPDAEMKDTAIRTLNVLAKNNIYNRDVIKQYLDNIDLTGYEEIAKNIIDQPLLWSNAYGTNPVNHKLENEPLPPECCSDVTFWRREKPEVKWTQDKWNILLTVTVKNVTRKDVASFTNDMITFRVVKECTEYTFEFLLYELIVPIKCEVEVRCGSVQIGLRKKTHGLWPRLLREKQKVPYLSVDFGRIDSSSDDSDQTEEEPEQGPLSLATKNIRKYVPFSLADGGAASSEQLVVESEETSCDSDASYGEELIPKDDNYKYDYLEL